jgi:hypothetical protein
MWITPLRGLPTIARALLLHLDEEKRKNAVQSEGNNVPNLEVKRPSSGP